MHKGTVSSKLAAERAWSLLEDWSPYTEKKYAIERVASAMNGYRKEAYYLVSNGSKDVSVLTCAHCVGVMLYCQYRGFGCAKEDFVLGYPNPLMLKTGLAAQLGSKVASLVAGLFHQVNGDHDQAIHHFERCRDVPMANVMRGDSYCALQKWREAYEAYQCATRLDHVVGMHCLGGMLKKGWGGKLDVIKGAELEQDALKRGYWRIVDAYYEGIGINGRKAADTFASGRSTRRSAVQDLTAQPSPAPAIPFPVSTGEDDGSSARKRHKNGGPAIEKDSDRSPIQVVKGAQPAASSSMVAGQSSRHDGTHVPLIALADVVVGRLRGVLSGNQLLSPAGRWARRTGPTVQQSGDRSQDQGGDGGHTHGPVGGSKATAVHAAKRTGTPVAKRTGTPVVDLTKPGNAAAVQGGDKSKHQGGNGGQAGGQGGISKATAVPRSVKPQSPPVKEGVQKKTTGLASNPIPPPVSSSASSSASRHKTCEHNKRRTRCPKCNGKSLCLHQKQKLHCRQCRNAGAFATCRSFCEHGRQRSRCKDCGGSGICEHGRDRYRCSQCR